VLHFQRLIDIPRRCCAPQGIRDLAIPISRPQDYRY
jgi:hypothetical protein